MQVIAQTNLGSLVSSVEDSQLFKSIMNNEYEEIKVLLMQLIAQTNVDDKHLHEEKGRYKSIVNVVGPVIFHCLSQ